MYKLLYGRILFFFERILHWQWQRHFIQRSELANVVDLLVLDSEQVPEATSAHFNQRQDRAERVRCNDSPRSLG